MNGTLQIIKDILTIRNDLVQAIKSLLLFIRRAFKLIIVCLLVSVAAIHFIAPRIGSSIATTTVLFKPLGDTNLETTREWARVYAALIASRKHAASVAVASSTNLGLNEQQIANLTQISISDGSDLLLEISVVGNGVEAVRICESMTDQLLGNLDDISNGAVELEVMSRAELVTQGWGSIEVNGIRYPNYPQAALFGVAIAMAIAFLRWLYDDRIKHDKDITSILSLDVLGVIERVDFNGRRAVVSEFGPRSPVSEAYRMLRTNIRFASVDEPLRTIVVTSAAPAEGKSTTAANLALVMAQSGQSVILVDADLRRPVQHTIFALPNYRGLTTALVERDISPTAYLQPTQVDGLRLLTSGPMPPNPSELLGSQRMRDLLTELEQESDVIILDVSPILAVTDASVVASVATGVVIVIRAEVSRLEGVRKSVEQLHKVQAKILGAVLNDVQVGVQGYYYYYYPSVDEVRKLTSSARISERISFFARLRTFILRNLR